MTKKGDAPSKKAEAKARQKIVEDKTFGLKNKNKSSKVAQYVQQVKASAAQGDPRKAKKEEEAKLAAKKRKEDEAKMEAERAALFKTVQAPQKVPFGTDPMSVLCQYFKAGQCNKGDKCKFSHDLNVERKSAKIDVFVDSRNQDQESDTMDKWDQSKLESVVSKKHGHGVKPTTDIICRYFLDAIENHKYGWFWECPNGGDNCKYKHALPPGYVLKRKMMEPDDDEDSMSLEEFLEGERGRLTGTLTLVTEETFVKWKEQRKKRLADEALASKKKKEADVKSGRAMASGMELFAANPDLFREDDTDALEEEALRSREEDPSDTSPTTSHDHNDETEDSDEEGAAEHMELLEDDLADLDVGEEEV